MGQSSSQPVPMQALSDDDEESTRLEEEEEEEVEEEMDAADNVDVLSASSEHYTTTMKAGKKRTRADDNESEHKPKKRKREDAKRANKKVSKRRRSIPQHRRGLAIQPSWDVEDEPRNQDDFMADQEGAAVADASADRAVEEEDMDSLEEPESGDAEESDSTPAAVQEASSSEDNEESPKEAHVTVKHTPRKAGLRVNPVGRPGPPKRKKQKVKPAKPDLDVIAEEAKKAAPEANANDAPPQDFIPTPPESPDQEQEAEVVASMEDDISESIPDDHIEDHQHADDRKDDGHNADFDGVVRPGYPNPAPKIQRWLTNGTPLPPDQASPSRGSPLQTRTSRLEQTPRNLAVNEDEHWTPPSQNKKWLPGSPIKVTKSNRFHEAADLRAQRGTLKGAWSTEEKELADSIFRDNVRKSGETEFGFKCNIMDWSGAGSLFRNDMYEAFPERTFAAIRKFSLRRYNCYDVGKWTAEQDDKLRTWYPVYPDNWVEISVNVDRCAEDCRDRWYRVVKHGGDMLRGPWSGEEEAKLRELVDEAIEVIEQDASPDSALSLEAAVDWNDVSKKMNGTRSSKRCREKWEQLRQRIEPAQQLAQAQRVVALPLSSKLQKAEAVYSELGWADVADCLLEIYHAVEADASREFPHESTFWSKVGLKLKQDTKFANKLRRRCYYGAVERVGSMQEVQDAVGMGNKALRMQKALKKLKKRGELVWERKYKVTSEDKNVPEEVKRKLEVNKKVAERKARKLLLEQHNERVENLPPPSRPTRRRSQPDYREELIEEHDEVDEEEYMEQEDEVFHEVESAIAMPPPPRPVQQPPLDTVAGAEEVQYEEIDDLPLSSINSDYERSLRDVTPRMSSNEFMARCQAVGRRQHQEYVSELHESRG